MKEHIEKYLRRYLIELKEAERDHVESVERYSRYVKEYKEFLREKQELLINTRGKLNDIFNLLRVN